MDWSQFCKKISVCSNSFLSCYYFWEVSGQLKCPFLCFPFFYSVLCFPVQASEKLHVGVLGSWWLADLCATLIALPMPFVHSGASIHFPTFSIHTNLLQSSASAALCLNLQMISNCGRDRNLKHYFGWMCWGVLLPVGFGWGRGALLGHSQPYRWKSQALL